MPFSYVDHAEILAPWAHLLFIDDGKLSVVVGLVKGRLINIIDARITTPQHTFRK